MWSQLLCTLARSETGVVYRNAFFFPGIVLAAVKHIEAVVAYRLGALPAAGNRRSFDAGR